MIDTHYGTLDQRNRRPTQSGAGPWYPNDQQRFCNEYETMEPTIAQAAAATSAGMKHRLSGSCAAHGECLGAACPGSEPVPRAIRVRPEGSSDCGPVRLRPCSTGPVETGPVETGAVETGAVWLRAGLDSGTLSHCGRPARADPPHASTKPPRGPAARGPFVLPSAKPAVWTCPAAHRQTQKSR